VGSAVLSYDEKLGRVAANPVTKVLHHAAEPIHRAVVAGVGHDLLLTTNHPFYSAGRWCAIRDLAPGAELLHFDFAQGEAPRRLLGLETTDRFEPVYNFEVECAHTYFVGGLLVHNGSILHSK
ncbi:MAG TPA: polymorphic toxin-type HINT domain-containing protein, partial [Thermoanaerobaculia bacterium]|nr:polymorphic toxin-type HINT domain-containing protein [Thermoanaerobaculia bacterium]